MGDRTWWKENCPSCGLDTVEIYDAPSSLQFSRRCGGCGWTDGLSYYEAEKRGFIS